MGRGLEEDASREHKIELDRIAAMLSRLGKRGNSVEDEPAAYGFDFDFDSDPDSDFDPDRTNSQQDASLDADKPQRGQAARVSSAFCQKHSAWYSLTLTKVATCHRKSIWLPFVT